MKKAEKVALALFGAALVLGIAACSNSAGGSTGGATITTPNAPTTQPESGGSGGGSVAPAPAGFVTVPGSTVAGGDKFKDATLDHSAGVFVAGRSVAISTFWICDHEVTQKEYETYCKYGETAPSDTYGKGDNYPAYYVSWYDAIVYCNLRSKAEGLTPCYKLKIDGSYKNFPDGWTGIVSEGGKYCGPAIDNSDWHRRIEFDASANGYRLPTEAEWEYAARGGKAGCEAASPTDWAGTDSLSEVGNYAWYVGNSGSKTHEVKTEKRANSLGLYDMSGNVWELCWDWYSEYVTHDDNAYKVNGVVTNPAGALSGSHQRVRRGGDLDDSAYGCSVALRDCNSPNYRGSVDSLLNRFTCLGFRVVRTAN